MMFPIDQKDFRKECDNLAELVLSFVIILQSISPWLNSQEKEQLKKYYSNYIRDLFPGRTNTVVHAAAQNRMMTGFKQFFTSYKDIKLILKLRADPNAIDEDCRTPLHILAQMQYTCLVEEVHLFKFLLKTASNLHIADGNGDTVLNVLKSRCIAHHPYFKSLVNVVFPLCCLCPAILHGIPFNVERLSLRF
jgi:hypothetical protein